MYLPVAFGIVRNVNNILIHSAHMPKSVCAACGCDGVIISVLYREKEHGHLVHAPITIRNFILSYYLVRKYEVFKMTFFDRFLAMR